MGEPQNHYLDDFFKQTMQYDSISIKLKNRQNHQSRQKREQWFPGQGSREGAQEHTR